MFYLYDLFKSYHLLMIIDANLFLTSRTNRCM